MEFIMARLDGVKCLWCCVPAANTRFEPQWSIDAIIDEEQADEFRAHGHKIKENAETGELSIKFKRNVTKKDGTSNKMPALVDSELMPFNESVGNGSIVNIQYREYEWKYASKSGVGLDLQAIQVVEHVPFAGGDGAEFTATPKDDF